MSLVAGRTKRPTLETCPEQLFVDASLLPALQRYYRHPKGLEQDHMSASPASLFEIYHLHHYACGSLETPTKHNLVNA
jgi:hypothetical protein